MSDSSHNDSPKVPLAVLGISYAPMQSGAFALLLAEKNGPLRIPVVIGAAEAQSIRIKLEGISTPRPMTHDLFCSFAHSFGISLKQVFIYKFEDGIFSAEVTFSDGVRDIVLDSRTSDAIALAVREDAPIFTTEEILHQVGTVFDENDNPLNRRRTSRHEQTRHEQPREQHSSTHNPADMSLAELQQLLDKLINDENYEEAAKISEIIKRRNQQ